MASTEAHEGSFRSHANYIAAFSRLCRLPYSDRDYLGPKLDRDLPNLKKAVLDSPSLAPPAKAPAPDLEQIEKSLNNAWGTELLLAFGRQVATEDALIRMMNNWGVVQAYYAAYHAVQALIVARGQPRPTTHPQTQKQFIDLWVDRPLQLAPWSLGANDGGICNAPPHRAPDAFVHPWISPVGANCWDLTALALRTTREDAIPEAKLRTREWKRREKRRAWREEEKARIANGRKPRKEPTVRLPRLTGEEHEKVEGKVRAYGLLDYLFRLRIKTNYEEAAMFIDGPTDRDSSWSVHSDLEFISATTLFVHELHIREIVGVDQLRAWCDEWLSHVAPGLTEMALAARRNLLVAD